MYSINDLKTFIAVVETGSVTRAAEIQRIATATASHRLSKLEDKLGVQLFHRDSRHCVPTDEGDEFFVRVRDILDALREAEYAIGSGDGAIRGYLRVTAAPWLLSRFILPQLSTFTNRNPDLKVEFMAVDRYVGLIEEGQDAAIRIGRLADSQMLGQKIVDNSRIICASPAYLKTHGVPKTAKDLIGHRWICLPWQKQWKLLSGKGIANRYQAQDQILISNSDLLTDAVVHGLGITIKSRLAVDKQLADGTLIEVLADTIVNPDAPVWLLRPPSKIRSRKVDAFFKFARGAIIKENV